MAATELAVAKIIKSAAPPPGLDLGRNPSHFKRDMALKYNPFQPNKMVVPGMFVGRLEEVNAIVQALFQAKNGNPPPVAAVGLML